MGKTVKLNKGYKSSMSYRSQLIENIVKLEDIEIELTSLAVNTAAVGAWKEWSDSMKEGDVFNFTEEMLKDTGDAHVDNITILVDNLITVKEKMKSKLELLV